MISEKINALYEAHQIGFNSVANARHMGGYVGAGGRVTRVGGVLRTAKLQNLSDEEAAILQEQWHLTNIVDFRMGDELSSAPDRQMTGVENRWISVVEMNKEQFLEALGKPLEEADIIDKLAASAKVVGGMTGLYASLVRQEISHRGYRTFFDILLSSEGTVLWHCSEGKDRTGFAAVLLLSVLGVDRETILDDYEASNVVYAEIRKALYQALLERGLPEDEASGVADLMAVNRSAMASALELIDAQYGGMDAFLHQQIGLTDEEIKALRDKYLE